jgi:hypothetical protein
MGAILAVLLATGCGRAPATASFVASEAQPQAPSVTLIPGTPDPAWQRLSREERDLFREGLLAADYPAARAAGREAVRRGLQGPFSDDFGDPEAMLAAARFAHTHAPYRAFLKNLHRGDLVFVAANDPHDFVAQLSGGPFDHVLLCTDPAPPGRFIEAVGITGEPGDAMGDRVRRASASRYASEGVTLRTGHVAGGHAELVEGAVAYAERQLGKPYNYTFSDDIAGERAFYCSSLVYKAYTQAGLGWRVAKDPARDRVALALIKPVLALEPDDVLKTAVEVMTFLHQTPAPDGKAFGEFIVRRVLPACRKTRDLVKSEHQKQALSDVLARVLDGKALPRLTAANAALVADDEAGKFSKGVGGATRHALARARVIESGAADVVGLLDESAMDRLAVLNALRTLAGAALPYADVLAAYMVGPQAAGTRLAKKVVDLTGRAPWETLPDLESPTDLAWSLPAFEDYNVKAGTPVAAPWPFALIPSTGDLGG